MEQRSQKPLIPVTPKEIDHILRFEPAFVQLPDPIINPLNLIINYPGILLIFNEGEVPPDHLERISDIIADNSELFDILPDLFNRGLPFLFDPDPLGDIAGNPDCSSLTI
jgi:hypothetical protein